MIIYGKHIISHNNRIIHNVVIPPPPYVWDTDALAFLAAAGITDNTQKEALNELVIDLKGYGIWTKLTAIYPFLGGTASSHKWNLKNPVDSNAAYRLQFFGGITHSATGVKPNGTNGYANTFLNPSINISVAAHISYYSRENINTATDQIDIGCTDGTRNLWLSAWYNGSGFNNILARNTSGSILLNGGVSVDSRGLFQTNKIGTTANLWKNASKLDEKTDSAGLANAVLYLFGYSGGSLLPTNRECAFSSIGEGLNDTEAANLYTAVNSYQTKLGRNI